MRGPDCRAAAFSIRSVLDHLPGLATLMQYADLSAVSVGSKTALELSAAAGNKEMVGAILGTPAVPSMLYVAARKAADNAHHQEVVLLLSTNGGRKRYSRKLPAATPINCTICSTTAERPAPSSDLTTRRRWRPHWEQTL